MIMMFLYVMFGYLCVLIMFAMKKKYIGYMLIIMMTMTVVNHGVIWAQEQKAKWNKKTEGITKNIDKVGDSIDKLGKSVDKINNNPVVKGTKKATNAIDEADKKIKDYGFKVREKITGKKTKRLGE